MAPSRRGPIRSRSPPNRSTIRRSPDRSRARSTVTSLGVTVSLDKTSGSPGDTFMMTVTNTGSVTDTYDSVAGRSGRAGGKPGTETKVTLAPGASQNVKITTSCHQFRRAGNIPV